MIITVGRQFGSGGRTIGKRLADDLGMEFYDKELINLASQESGISGDFFEKADEKHSGTILGAFIGGFSFNNSGFYQSNDFLSGESLFKIQSDVIRKIASEKSCVIVGRCADYILRKDPACIRIFISANERDRIKRIMGYTGASESEAKQKMQRADKMRAGYYNYYTDKVWGAAASYDLCINSSIYGEETTLEIIKNFCSKHQF